MANQKITDYPAGTGLKSTDIVDVSVDNGDGTFTTKSFTVAQVKAIAENLGNANLTQSAAYRKYNILSGQILEFINGDFKITKSASNYVYWEDGGLIVRAAAGDAQTPLSVRDNANAALFDVSADGIVTSFADFYLPNADEETPVKSLGLSSTNKVIKYNQENILWKARISQSGTAAPALTEFIDNTGNAITASRSSVGTYVISGFAGQLSPNCTIEFEGNGIPEGASVKIFSATGTDDFVIETYDNTNTKADGIMLTDNAPTRYYFNAITIKKY